MVRFAEHDGRLLRFIEAEHIVGDVDGENIAVLVLVDRVVLQELVVEEPNVKDVGQVKVILQKNCIQ